MEAPVAGGSAAAEKGDRTSQRERGNSNFNQKVGVDNVETRYGRQVELGN